MQSAVAMSFAQMCGCGMKQTLGKQQNIIFPILQSHHDEILTAVLVMFRFKYYLFALDGRNGLIVSL